MELQVTQLILYLEKLKRMEMSKLGRLNGLNFKSRKGWGQVKIDLRVTLVSKQAFFRFSRESNSFG